MVVDRAFSAVVADNQYAALGLMLLGTLARIKTLIRPLGKEVDDEPEVEVEGKPEGLDKNTGDDFGEVVKREELQSLGVEEGNGRHMEHQEDEDNGVQNRKSTEKRKRANETSDSHKQATVERTPMKPPKKKKRRKHGDALDDLFDSLI